MCNEAPTDLALQQRQPRQDNAANASVGTLSASGDPDAAVGGASGAGQRHGRR